MTMLPKPRLCEYAGECLFWPGEPQAPHLLTKPKLLMGEGSEEVIFFGALLKELGVADVQVELYGGKPGLGRYLKTLRNRPGFRAVASLGITQDADESPAGARERICQALGASGFAIPRPDAWEADGSPRVSILVLPDRTNRGMLEDVCLAAIRKCPEYPCIDAFFECINSATGRAPAQLAKAYTRAWLSSLQEPDRRLGEAAAAGCIPWESPAFDLLKQFLVGL